MSEIAYKILLFLPHGPKEGIPCSAASYERETVPIYSMGNTNPREYLRGTTEMTITSSHISHWENEIINTQTGGEETTVQVFSSDTSYVMYKGCISEFGENYVKIVTSSKPITMHSIIFALDKKKSRIQIILEEQQKLCTLASE